MSAREEAALARFRLQLARQAASRGALAEARRALLNLAESDFAGGASVCSDQLAVLRNHRSPTEDVEAAVQWLVSLRARGAP